MEVVWTISSQVLQYPSRIEKSRGTRCSDVGETNSSFVGLIERKKLHNILYQNGTILCDKIPYSGKFSIVMATLKALKFIQIR